MTSNGSSTHATYVKKMPDHQREAVAKILPYSLVHKERFSAPTRTIPNGFKTFADFNLVAERLKSYEKNIQKVKTYKDYDDLT
jgi:hypothetical protein